MESNAQGGIAEAAACFNSGDMERAEKILRKLVVESPAAAIYANLGVVCGRQGKHDEAIVFLNRAVELEPESVDFQFKLARAYQRHGRVDDAIGGFQRTIELDGRHTDALSELGTLYVESRRTDEAAACFRKVISINPQHFYAHNNLGIALRRLGSMDDAIEYHRQAIALIPSQAVAHDSLGTAYANCLRVDEAIACHKRAIALEPGNGAFHLNHAFALLLAGRFDDGWEEYEWRWRASELRREKPAFDGPEWRGERISGKTVLLYGEQGHGDVIQFVRYARLVEKLGGKALLGIHRDLARLVAGAAGVIGVNCPGDPLPCYDYHAPLLSLPRLFRTTVETIPSGVPYLRTDTTLVESWRARMAGTNGLRVGLIWAGRHTFQYDHWRSCALADFAGLSAIGGVQLYSLQKGDQAAQAKSRPAGMSLIDWSGELGDFADTAALMENLDVIVSVDTAGAHLAGALGRPVWLLNRYQTDWRWLLEREDSPWYPTMRVFRQPRPGDRKPVVERVAAELKALVESRAS